MSTLVDENTAKQVFYEQQFLHAETRAQRQSALVLMGKPELANASESPDIRELMQMKADNAAKDYVFGGYRIKLTEKWYQRVEKQGGIDNYIEYERKQAQSLERSHQEETRLEDNSPALKALKNGEQNPTSDGFPSSLPLTKPATRPGEDRADPQQSSDPYFVASHPDIEKKAHDSGHPTSSEKGDFERACRTVDFLRIHQTEIDEFQRKNTASKKNFEVQHCEEIGMGSEYFALDNMKALNRALAPSK